MKNKIKHRIEGVFFGSNAAFDITVCGKRITGAYIINTELGLECGIYDLYTIELILENNGVYEIGGVSISDLKLMLFYEGQELEQLQAKVERYEETLKFYADPETYKEKETSTLGVREYKNDEYLPTAPLYLDIALDRGSKAREALEDK